MKQVSPRSTTTVGVIGASSMVGECLLPLLTQAGYSLVAYSRHQVSSSYFEWRELSTPSTPAPAIAFWICIAPIWVLPEHLSLMEAHGVRRIVALSSTSRFTKDNSADSKEQAVAARLANAEIELQNWAESRGIEWVVLRPTLIYGLGRDQNITEIARIISRFGCFPLLGKASGLRQPIHAADVAQAALGALQPNASINRAYNLSGGETLSYRDMVQRIFAALGRKPCLFPVPLFVFRIAVFILRLLPRYRGWSPAMVGRMNKDLVFEHTEATQCLKFHPRPFFPTAEDVCSQRN